MTTLNSSTDLEQRAGRIVRQGNENKEVTIYRYITQDTFDTYLWQMIENKQRFISQIMTSKTPIRSADDVDAVMITYMSTKTVCTSDPYLKERMNLEMDIMQLKLLEQNYKSNLYQLEDKVHKIYPLRIEAFKQNIVHATKDLEKIVPKVVAGFNGITLGGTFIEDKKIARERLHQSIMNVRGKEPVCIGAYRGFDLYVSYFPISSLRTITIQGEGEYQNDLSDSMVGHFTRLDHLIDVGIQRTLESNRLGLVETENKLAIASEEIKKPFEKEKELKEKLERMSYLNQSIKEPDSKVDIEDMKAYFISMLERFCEYQENEDLVFPSHSLKENIHGYVYPSMMECDLCLDLESLTFDVYLDNEFTREVDLSQVDEKGGNPLERELDDLLNMMDEERFCLDIPSEFKLGYARRQNREMER